MKVNFFGAKVEAFSKAKMPGNFITSKQPLWYQATFIT